MHNAHYDKVLKETSLVVSHNPNLRPLFLLSGCFPSERGAEGARVAVELQLEDKQIRERVIDSTQHLLKLINEATTEGLLKQGEYADQHWLLRTSRDQRYIPDPIQGVLPVLNEHIELFERRLVVWRDFAKRPRATHERLERVRTFLMHLSPGIYEAEDRLRYIEPYKPRAPYSGIEYAKQLGNPRSFTIEDISMVNHAFRLEGLSERILRRSDPKGAAAIIDGWWRLRYQKHCPEEPKFERRERIKAGMDSYGIGVQHLQLPPPGIRQEFALEFQPQGAEGTRCLAKVKLNEPTVALSAFDFEVPPPTILQRSVKDKEALFNKFFSEPLAPGTPEATTGWEELDPKGRMVSTQTKMWKHDEPEHPPLIRYKPTIEVKHPDIQKAFELLAPLTKYLLAFKGFDQMRDVVQTPAGGAVALYEQAPQADPTQWPAPGQSVSIVGSEMTIRTLENGQIVIRWELETNNGTWKIPNRPSVVEVLVGKHVFSKESFDVFQVKLRNEYQLQREKLRDNPLQQPFFTALHSMGELRRLENFRLRPISEDGTALFQFNLAAEAELRDLVASDPGVVIRLRGSSALFENIDLLGSALDISIGKATWQNCHLTPRTVVRGSLGVSVFDELSKIQWDGAQADMQLIEILGGELQERLKGLLFRGDNFSKTIMQQLRTKNFSQQQWEEVQREHDTYFGRVRLIKIIKSLDSQIKHEPAAGSVCYDQANRVAGDRERDSLAIFTKQRVPNHLFRLRIADPQDQQPCKLDFFICQQQIGTKRLDTMKVTTVWGKEPIHYHRALFELLDFYFEGRINWPSVQLQRRGTALDASPLPVHDDIACVG